MTLSTGDAFFPFIPMSVVLKEQAALAGINITIEEVPADGYWSDTWMVKPFVTSYWGERHADQALNEIFTCAAVEKGGWNETFWCNEEFDQLLADARAETDFDKRQALFQQAQALLAAEGGTINPFFRLSTRVLNARVQGIQEGFREIYYQNISLLPG